MEIIIFGDPTNPETLIKISDYYQKHKERLRLSMERNKNTPEPLTYFEYTGCVDFTVRLCE